MISIGKRYEESFRSILALVQNNCVDKNIIESVTADTIYTANQNTFVYDPTISNVDSGANVGITKKGASWFNGLRGKKMDKSDALWQTLIENVATGYHKKYSLLSVDLSKQKEDGELLRQNEQTIQKVVQFFYRDFAQKNYTIKKIEGNQSIDDIYSLSLKVEISSGTGEALPLLCKVYFIRRDDALIPMESTQAEIVDSFIRQYIEEKNDNTSGEIVESDSSMIDYVFNAFQDLIKCKIQNLEFSDCAFFCAEEDRNNLTHLVETGPYGHVNLECTDVKVFNVFHIRWKNTSYQVLDNAIPALKICFEINNQISMYCLNCHSEALIENNRVILTEAGEKEGIEPIYLDLNAAFFGLKQPQIQAIEQFGAFKEHIYYHQCPANQRNQMPCRKLICSSQLVSFKENQSLEAIRQDPNAKCKNCPYPEIVYRDFQGNAYLTSQIQFARDKMDLTKEKVSPCPICGREFTEASMKQMRGNLSQIISSECCSFCRDISDKISNEKTSAECKKNYRRYKTMFSIPFRTFHLFQKKYAFEDSDVLVFLIGKKFYSIDKLTLDSTKLLMKPQRRKEQ